MRNLFTIGTLGLALTLASPGAKADDDNASYFLLGTLVGSQLHSHHSTRLAPVYDYNARVYRYQRAKYPPVKRHHLRRHLAHHGHHEYRYGDVHRAGQHGRNHRRHGWSQSRDHHRRDSDYRAYRDDRDDRDDRGHRARPPRP